MGVGLWSGGAGGDGQAGRVDQDLEDFKRAVMNEIELDFSWYCRERSRTRQEMEEWWDRRGQLVDALLEDAWPAWGTAGALRRCKRLVELRAASWDICTGNTRRMRGEARVTRRARVGTRQFAGPRKQPESEARAASKTRGAVCSCEYTHARHAGVTRVRA